MGRRWTVPVYKLSLMFIYMTGNIFDKGRFMFRLYLFYVLFVALSLVKTLVLLTQAVTEGNESLKLIIDLLVLCYEIPLIIKFGIVHEDMADLMRCLREGLSDYTSCDISDETEAELNKILAKTRITEMIIINNILKGLCCFAIYPILYDQKGFPLLHDYLTVVLGTFTDSVLIYFNILIDLIVVVSLCAFHNNWEIIMVSSISCLTGELNILTESIATIDRRAQSMFEALRGDLEVGCWSSYLRPEMPRARLRPRQVIEYDEKMREMCLFECLKENIRHHQDIIKTTAKLNKVVGMCSFIYTHTVGITVAICLFLIAQVDHILSPRALLYCLILVPTMMSQGLICVYGQELLDKSEDLRYSLYTSNWQTKSKRYISCLRIMMLRSHRPLCLRSVIYIVNKTNYVEFLKAGYSFLNCLLTMKKNTSKEVDISGRI